MESRTDGDLLQEFARTHAGAPFAELVRRHGAMVHGVCRRVTGREDLAEEAANAAFLVLARKAAAVASRPDAGGWLHRIADHVARRARDAERRRRFHETRAAAMKTVGSEGSPAGREELLQNVDAALGKLREGERAVVVGLYLEGRPRKDLAAALGLPEGTVASRSAAALEKLRRFLGVQGLLVSPAGLGAILSETAGAASVPASFASLPALASSFAVTKAAGMAGAGLLAQGVLKTMLWTKMAVATSVVVAVTGIGIVTPEAYRAVAGETAAPQKAAPAIVGETGEPKKDAPAIAEPAGEEAVAVHGLRLVLRPARPGVNDLAVITLNGPVAGLQLMAFSCRILAQDERALEVAIPPLMKATLPVEKIKTIKFAKQIPGPSPLWVADPERDHSYTLRWENAGKEALALTRDRCCDLYDHVFLKGPDGKLVPARRDNRARFGHGPAEGIRVEPAKCDEEMFNPWHWVVKPEVPGEYVLWVEFEQGVPPKPVGKHYWQGKVRSNAVKVEIKPQGAAAGKVPAGAPDEATARKLALEYLAKQRPAVKPAGVQAFAIPGGAFWMVEYRDAQSRGPLLSPGPCVWVNAKTGEVSEQAPAGAPARM